MRRSPRRARISGPGQAAVVRPCVGAHARRDLQSDEMRASSVISTIFGSGLASAASASFSPASQPLGCRLWASATARGRHDDEQNN